MMKTFIRLSAVIVLCLSLGMSALMAQTFSAGPESPAANLQGLGFSWADVNNDGSIDLFVEPANLIINQNNGYRFVKIDASGVVANSNTVGSIFGDFNGDGYPDLVVTQGGASPKLYINTGASAFVDTTAGAGDLATVTPGSAGQMYNATAADYDRDGNLDIAWAGSANQSTALMEGQVRLLKGASNLLFTTVAGGVTAAPPVIDTAKRFECWNPEFIDVNNDGYVDLFLPSFRNGLTANNPTANTGGSRSILYLNNGDGTFSVPARSLYTGIEDTGLVVNDTVRHYSAIGSAWADFDNDGIVDLAISALGGATEEQGRGLKVLKGLGDGTFTEVLSADTQVIQYYNGARGIAWGDYDNDGYVDLLQSGGWSAPNIWRNNGNGTFTNFTRDALTMPGGNSRSCNFVDVNNDGFLDVYTAPQDQIALNGGNSNHWIAFKPEGAGNNKMAIGARFKIYTQFGTMLQVRSIEAGGSGGATNGNVYAQFGIGTSTTIDSLVVVWPDGTTQSFDGANLAVDQYWSVKEGAVIPETVTLSSPVDAAVDQTPALDLHWATAAGALLYQVQVSLDPTFATNVVIDNNTVSGTSLSVELGNSTQYYWRVRGLNAGFIGSWSSVFDYTTAAGTASVPVLISPASDAVNQPVNLTLSVGKTAGAAQYNWQISTDNIFTAIVVNDSTVDTTRTVVLTAGTQYFWRVRAVNPGSQSEFSNSRGFVTMQIADVPALVFPESNKLSTRRDTLVLSWNQSGGAVSYECEISVSDTFSPFVKIYVEDRTVTDTTYRITGLSAITKYYWRVRANNAGGQSGYSVVDSFTTIVPIPAAPAVVSPNLAEEVPTNATFVWRQVTYTEKYRLQVATTNTYADSVKVVDITVTGGAADTTLTLVTELAAETDYFWRVCAIDTAGTSAWSGNGTFTTGTGPVAVTALNSGIPQEFSLLQNYPNPFNPTTTIRYDLPMNAHVTLTIYDMLGREVAKLVDGMQPANRYSIEWNASNLSSSVYFYRISAKGQNGSKDFTSVKKLILLK